MCAHLAFDPAVQHKQTTSVQQLQYCCVVVEEIEAPITMKHPHTHTCLSKRSGTWSCCSQCNGRRYTMVLGMFGVVLRGASVRTNHAQVQTPHLTTTNGTPASMTTASRRSTKPTPIQAHQHPGQSTRPKVYAADEVQHQHRVELPVIDPNGNVYTHEKKNCCISCDLRHTNKLKTKSVQEFTDCASVPGSIWGPSCPEVHL